MMASAMSLAVTPGPVCAFHAHTHVARLLLQQALRGQHVLDLGGADAECQRAERAVRGGVRIAAYHRHARQGRALLRPDHVHDALTRIVHTEFGDAEYPAVLVQRFHLLARHRIVDAPRRGRWSARCGRAPPAHCRCATACAPPGAALRRPAGWSLRAPDAGRYRATPCRPPRCARHGHPKFVVKRFSCHLSRLLTV